MSWLNIQYESNLRKNDKRDGMKALAVYCLIMCSAFCQGWLYTTNINVIVLNLSLNKPHPYSNYYKQYT